MQVCIKAPVFPELNKPYLCPYVLPAKLLSRNQTFQSGLPISFSEWSDPDSGVIKSPMSPTI